MPLTGQQVHAALLVAQGRYTNKQIAQKLAIAGRTLDYWKADPEFKRAVQEHLDAWMRDLYNKGIADRRRRLFQLNDRWRRAQAIVQARAQDPATRKLPGGASGFICRTLRSVNLGAGQFQVVAEGTFDAALYRELSAIEEQAARELGQWDVKDERQIRRLADLSREEIDALMADISKTYGIPMPAAGGGETPA